jgi:hypothetical protein
MTEAHLGQYRDATLAAIIRDWRANPESRISGTYANGRLHVLEKEWARRQKLYKKILTQ